ncbi:hypothetical protein [Acinetobacter bohemicus]|uniref:hypothetical protein n=1 Tax=Acinetobacter bohemicus TaxID=1435036 RepID=UPI0040426421
MLTLGYIYPFSTLAATPVMMQLVTVDSGLTRQDLIDKYGKDAVEDYFDYIYTNAKNRKPLSDLDLEYKPHFEYLEKYKANLHRSNLDRASKQALSLKIREEYSRLLEEKSQKYKRIIELKLKYVLDNLADKEALESYQVDVPNIDKIHQSLEIYTCAEIVRVFEKKTNVGAVINEMEGSEYQVFGLNELEKNLLASPNQDRSFEYASIIMQSEITPPMPYYLFLDKLINYRLLVREYAKFTGDPKVLATLQKYSQSMCLPYAEYVRNG